MQKYNTLFIIILMLAFSACQKEYAKLETAQNVNLNKYVGKWYEIASIPQRFQKGCTCTTAEYIKKDGYIEVINKCINEDENGELETAKGKAFLASDSSNSKLQVQFFWPFKGDYWIVELGDNYEYAAVGAPSREYLWILSRKPSLEKASYDVLLGKLANKGFPITELQKTDQSCSTDK